MELCQVEILYDVRFNWSDNYFRHRVEYLRKKTRADNSDTCQNLQWQNLGRAEIVWIPAKFLIHLMMQENLWKNKARVRQLIKFKIAFCVSQFHMAVEANFLIISRYSWLKAYDWVLYNSILCFDYKVCGTQSPVRLWFYRALKFFYNTLLKEVCWILCLNHSQKRVSKGYQDRLWSMKCLSLA